MKLTYILSDLDREITLSEFQLTLLKERKNSLAKLNEQFPNAHYEHNAICLDDIWHKITCMRIRRVSRYYYNSKVNVSFLLGKRDAIEGIKIHTHPYEQTIAEIASIYNPSISKNRVKEMLIFDYAKLIPEQCPDRAKFLKRIKKYLIGIITRENLLIKDGSFNQEEYQRLILLK
jgi:hypothetical protein